VVEVRRVIDYEDRLAEVLLGQVGQEQVGAWNDAVADHGAVAVDHCHVRAIDRPEQTRPAVALFSQHRFGGLLEVLPSLGNEPTGASIPVAGEDFVPDTEKDRRSA
jgi:hypothetical protein